MKKSSSLLRLLNTNNESNPSNKQSELIEALVDIRRMQKKQVSMPTLRNEKIGQTEIQST